MNASDDSPDPMQRQRIVEQGTQFEGEWRAGRQPSIEAFLEQACETDRPKLLRELIAVEIELRRARGEHPAPLEYQDRFRGHGALVNAAFAGDPIAHRPADAVKSPPERSNPDTARNLLFGVLALQNSFIDRAALLSAFNAWTGDKTKPLGRILVDQGKLDDSRHALLSALVAEHLKLHGDEPDRSLAALSSLGPVRHDLELIADPDLAVSLGNVSTPRAIATDPYATLSCVGAPTSTGVRFHIIRPHARGGLGEVFAAFDGELHREVALKCIQEHHADDPASRTRFVQEAEITGGLEHPGVVPVYGLGYYSNGRPFYAMRLVKGDSLRTAITQFHEADRDPKRDPGERTVSLRRLLGRFLDVCNAIAYAHSRGVLHRDLKPGNILLGKYGETLIIDWGLAKVVGRPELKSDDAEPTLRPPSGSALESTRAGSAIGTPGYMSPEQARGDIDRLGPASDVFSLGATLYHLLAGRSAFDGDDFAERLQKNERCEFRSPGAIKSSVPRPLEAICLKAMAPQPGDRYTSPGSLAGDIEHWLADEPVSALREPWSTSLRRWARRHRTLVAAATASLLIATTLLVGVWGWVRHRRQDAVQSARSWLFEADRLAIEASDKSDLTKWGEAVAAARQAKGILETGGDDADLRRRIDTRLAALRTQERDRQMLKDLDEASLVRASATNPEFLDACRKAFRRYGIDVESLPPAQAISLIRASAIQKDLVWALDEWATQLPGTELLTRLRSIARELDNHPMRNAIRDAFGTDDVELGRLLRELVRQSDISQYPPTWLAASGFYFTVRGKPDAGIPVLAAAQRIYPDNVFVNFHLGQAFLFRSAPNFIEAIRFLSIAVALRPDSTKAHYELGRALRGNGDLDAASKEFERTIEIDPAHLSAYVELAETNRQLGRPTEALNFLMKALAVYERLLRSDAKKNQSDDALVGIHDAMSNILERMGRRDEALESTRKSLAIRERRTRAQPENFQLLADLFGRHTAFGNLLDQMGRKPEAFESFERVLAIRERLLRLLPDTGQADDAIVGIHDSASSLLQRLGRTGDFLESTQKALAIRERRTKASPDSLIYQNDLAAGYIHVGHLLDQAGRKTEASRSYEKALAVYVNLVETKPGKDQSDDALLGVHDAIGNLLNRMGRHSDAIESFQRKVAIRERRVQAQPDNISYRMDMVGAIRELGILQIKAGQTVKAADSARRVVAIGERLAREHPESAEVASWLGVMLHNLPALDFLYDRSAVRETIRRAIMHQKRALALDPKNADYPGHLRNHLFMLANVALAHRVPEEAYEAAREWAALVAGNSKDLYNAAEYLSRCVPLAKEKAERDRYIIAAIEMLRSVIAAVPSDADPAAGQLDPYPLNFGAYNRIGSLNLRIGRDADARESYLKARMIGERLVRERPSSDKVASELGLTLHGLAILESTQDRSLARATMRQGLVLQKRAILLNPSELSYQVRLYNLVISLRRVAAEQGVPAEAIEAARVELAVEPTWRDRAVSGNPPEEFQQRFVERGGIAHVWGVATARDHNLAALLHAGDEQVGILQ
jgi:eukaryotic-like serine/threonine-protein kinase